MTSLRNCLDRTLLLMRDDVGDSPTDDQLLDALTSTTVALSAGAGVLALPQAQTAFATIAMLAARSGHRIHLMAPDVRLVNAQPPFRGSHLISALMEADGDLLPLRQFTTDAPVKPVDICATLDGARYFDARHTLGMSASAWATRLTARQHPPLWSPSNNWPLGTLAGSAIVAAEIFKASMQKLRNFAINPILFDPLFEPINELSFALAPDVAPTPSALGTFDCVSGGAISNAALYVLSRIPGVEGSARVVEPELADHSNLNRYAFLRLSDVPASKAPLLAAQNLGLLKIDPIENRYDESFLGRFGPMASRMLIGVDHIPSRWAAQKADPAWLGIGATTHWDAGPKGSATDLVLCCVLHVAEARGLIPLQAALDATKQPLVRAVAPIALGDNLKGWRIVGTTPNILSVYRAGLASGKMWSKALEAVVGSEAAQALKLKIGDSFVGAHGLAVGGEQHSEFPYKVTGILAPTGSALDRLVLTDLESVYVIHRHHEAEAAAERGVAPPAAAPPAASAVLVAFRSPIGMAVLPRKIDATAQFSTASPALEAARFVRAGRPLIIAVTALGLVFAGIAAASMAMALLVAMGARAKDLALLRALGAHPWELATVASVEAGILAAGATIIGFGIAMVLTHAAANMLAARDGLLLLAAPHWADLAWIGCGASIAAVLAALAPAFRAARAPIERVLSA